MTPFPFPLVPLVQGWGILAAVLGSGCPPLCVVSLVWGEWRIPQGDGTTGEGTSMLPGSSGVIWSSGRGHIFPVTLDGQCWCVCVGCPRVSHPYIWLEWGGARCPHVMHSELFAATSEWKNYDVLMFYIIIWLVRVN